jgi:hypothetical protein
MSNIIQYLEAIGRDPTFAALGPDQYAAAIAALDIDEAPRKALLRRDGAALNDALCGRPTLFCLVAPAEDDDAPTEEPAQDEPAEDAD